MRAEVWRDVVGYEGHYQVSNFGNVRRFVYMRPYPSYSKYETVVLYRQGKRKAKSVHRMVAEAFMPYAIEGLCVNHKDGNKQNNELDNLEWVTHAQNMAHAARLGLMQKGDKHFSRRHPERVRRGFHSPNRPPMSEATKEKIRNAKLGKPSPIRKLTFGLAEEIRLQHSAGATMVSLCKKHKVCHRTIWDIVNHKKYRS